MNRFDYHDRTLEDKRGNDLARLSGEPWSKWPEPINDGDVPHLCHFIFSANHLAGAYSKCYQARDMSIARMDHQLVKKRTQPIHLGQFRVSDQGDMHVFGLWQETRNPLKH